MPERNHPQPSSKPIVVHFSDHKNSFMPDAQVRQAPTLVFEYFIQQNQTFPRVWKSHRDDGIETKSRATTDGMPLMMHRKPYSFEWSEQNLRLQFHTLLLFGATSQMGQSLLLWFRFITWRDSNQRSSTWASWIIARLPLRPFAPHAPLPYLQCNTKWPSGQFGNTLSLWLSRSKD